MRDKTLICRMSGGDDCEVNWAAVVLTRAGIDGLLTLRSLFSVAASLLPKGGLYRLELQADSYVSPRWYKHFDQAGEDALALSAGWELKGDGQRLRVKDETDGVECEYLSVHKEGVVWSCRERHSDAGDLETPMLTYADLYKMSAGK